jgi:hypothetical protein
MPFEGAAFFTPMRLFSKIDGACMATDRAEGAAGASCRRVVLPRPLRRRGKAAFFRPQYFSENGRTALPVFAWGMATRLPCRARGAAQEGSGGEDEAPPPYKMNPRRRLSAWVASPPRSLAATSRAMRAPELGAPARPAAPHGPSTPLLGRLPPNEAAARASPPSASLRVDLRRVRYRAVRPLRPSGRAVQTRRQRQLIGRPHLIPVEAGRPRAVIAPLTPPVLTPSLASPRSSRYGLST